MKNIVYFSGSHGSGKTTLIKKLAEKEPETFSIYKKMLFPQKFQDMPRRQKIRLVRYYLRANYVNEMSKENPDKIILCDRCSYDNLAYFKGFHDIGWVTKKELEEYCLIHNSLMSEGLESKNIIFFNPPLKETIHNIKKRWKETGKKKWKEDNFEYLKAVRKGFEEIYSTIDANILEVKFMDLEKRVSECYSWIKRLNSVPEKGLLLN